MPHIRTRGRKRGRPTWCDKKGYARGLRRKWQKKVNSHHPLARVERKASSFIPRKIGEAFEGDSARLAREKKRIEEKKRGRNGLKSSVKRGATSWSRYRAFHLGEKDDHWIQKPCDSRLETEDGRKNSSRDYGNSPGGKRNRDISSATRLLRKGKRVKPKIANPSFGTGEGSAGKGRKMISCRSIL